MKRIAIKSVKKIIAVVLFATLFFTLKFNMALADEAIVFYEMPECPYSFFNNGFEDYGGWSRIDMTSMWYCNSAAYAVKSPVNADEHGKVARLVASKAQDINFNTQYPVVSDIYNSGTLRRLKVEADICFEGYAAGVISMIDSGYNKSKRTFNELVSFNGNGFITVTGNNYKNDTVKEKYKKLNLNTWYSLRFDIDTENNTFTFFINGEAITENAKLPADAADFSCMRIYLEKASDENNGNVVYTDNWKYSVEEEKLSEISLMLENNSAVAEFTGYGKKYKNSKLIIAVFNADGTLALCKEGSKTDYSDITHHTAVENISEGQTAKAFLLSDYDSLKPIVSSYARKKYTQEDFAILREKWRKALTADDEVNFNSQSVKDRLVKIEKSGENAFYNLVASPTYPQDPWGSVITETTHMSNAYSRIYNLARAYGTKGCRYYHNKQFLDKTIYCLEYMYDNFYGDDEINGTGWKKTTDYSWWDWFVQTPRFLTDSLIMLGDSIDYNSVCKYLALFDHLRDTMEGVPQLSRVYGVFASSVLEGDSGNLEKIENLIRSNYEYTNTSIGMHKDGSYTDHNNIAYNAMYGTALAERVTLIYNITANTPFAEPKSFEKIFRQWVEDAYEPLLVNGGFMSMVNGRGIAYEESERSYALTLFEQILASVRNKCLYSDYYKKIIRENIIGDTAEYYLKNLTVNSIDTLEKILDSAHAAERTSISKVYAGMDRVVHRRDDWTCGIAMSSSRIANYESIDWQNTDGWYTGDGMLYIYKNDGTSQYDLSYWKSVNHYRMPGTTEDVQQRKSTSIVLGREFFPDRDFVGGATDGEYSVASMDFEAYHCEDDNHLSTNPNGTNRPQHFCTLEANKSWFMFDDEIVCLGCGINADDNSEVRTYVENKKQNGAVTVNKDNYVHISDVGGYVFTNGAKPTVNTSDNDFIEMWLSHGANPKNESYEYVILPCKTQQETASYANNPDVEILANNTDVQAVCENSLSLTGYVFRKGTTFGKVSVSEPVILMIRESTNGCILSIAEPTHKISDVTVVLDGRYTALSADSHIKVQSGDKTVIKVDTSGAAGKTYSVSLKG